LLRSSKSGNFDDDSIADWTLLIETLLGWLQWLKSEQMLMAHVDASVEASLSYVPHQEVRQDEEWG
jgi:hypothetical protein